MVLRGLSRLSAGRPSSPPGYYFVPLRCWQRSLEVWNEAGGASLDGGGQGWTSWSAGRKLFASSKLIATLRNVWALVLVGYLIRLYSTQNVPPESIRCVSSSTYTVKQCCTFRKDACNSDAVWRHHRRFFQISITSFCCDLFQRFHTIVGVMETRLVPPGTLSLFYLVLLLKNVNVANHPPWESPLLLNSESRRRVMCVLMKRTDVSMPKAPWCSCVTGTRTQRDFLPDSGVLLTAEPWSDLRWSLPGGVTPRGANTDFKCTVADVGVIFLYLSVCYNVWCPTALSKTIESIFVLYFLGIYRRPHCGSKCSEKEHHSV